MAYHGKYEAPAEILHDDSLSRDEKIRLLEQWHTDKKAYMRASGEGMEAEEDRPDLLMEIKTALSSLRDGSVKQ